jgi:hypothetical protein
MICITLTLCIYIYICLNCKKGQENYFDSANECRTVASRICRQSQGK